MQRLGEGRSTRSGVWCGVVWCGVVWCGVKRRKAGLRKGRKEGSGMQRKRVLRVYACVGMRILLMMASRWLEVREGVCGRGKEAWRVSRLAGVLSGMSG